MIIVKTENLDKLVNLVKLLSPVKIAAIVMIVIYYYQTIVINPRPNVLSLTLS